MIPDIKKILAESAPVLAKAQEEVFGEEFSIDGIKITGIFNSDQIKLSSQKEIQTGAEIIRIKTGIIYEVLSHENTVREGVFAFQKLRVKPKDSLRDS